MVMKTHSTVEKMATFEMVYFKWSRLHLIYKYFELYMTSVTMKWVGLLQSLSSKKKSPSRKKKTNFLY